MPASVPTNGSSAYHHNQKSVFVSVGHNGCITEAGGHSIDVASLAIGYKEFLSPRGAIVCRDAAFDIHLAIADVIPAGAVVRYSKEMSVRCSRNGWNTVRLAVGIGAAVECMPIGLVRFSFIIIGV